MVLLENLVREISPLKRAAQLRKLTRELNNLSTVISRNFEAQLRRRFPHRFDLTVVTFSHSSTVLMALRQVRNRIARLRVARSLPLGEGEVTVKAAIRYRLPAELFEDGRLAFAVRQCDLVVVGADCVLPNGSVINKVGTSKLARICAWHDKPFWIVTSRYKFASHRHIQLFQKVGPRRIQLFDITPRKWIDQVITEKGHL
jgi:translation initiation factor 2B subunit (eIF-2B alpha/beta/delta family)